MHRRPLTLSGRPLQGGIIFCICWHFRAEKVTQIAVDSTKYHQTNIQNEKRLSWTEVGPKESQSEKYPRCWGLVRKATSIKSQYKIASFFKSNFGRHFVTIWEWVLTIYVKFAFYQNGNSNRKWRCQPINQKAVSKTDCIFGSHF